MKTLTAFVLDGHEIRIRPATVEREWMDETDQRFAYRCLPLNIANAHGWEILCPTYFSAIWDGQKGVDAIRIQTSAGAVAPAVSHFGHGILTFHVPCLFRTDPGIDLFAGGPINRPKDAIAALSGVIETDWSPYTFTMNWKFTRAFQKVYFEENEPYCHIFPMTRGSLENVEPEMRPLSDEPDIQEGFTQWMASRNNFNATLSDPISKAAQDKWQKSYFQGIAPSGDVGAKDHRSRLRLRPFKRK